MCHNFWFHLFTFCFRFFRLYCIVECTSPQCQEELTPLGVSAVALLPLHTSSPERRITQKEIIAGEERPKYVLQSQYKPSPGMKWNMSSPTYPTVVMYIADMYVHIYYIQYSISYSICIRSIFIHCYLFSIYVQMHLVRHMWICFASLYICICWYYVLSFRFQWCVFLLYYYRYLCYESLTQQYSLSFVMRVKYLNIIGIKFTLNPFDHVEVKFSRVGATEDWVMGSN